MWMGMLVGMETLLLAGLVCYSLVSSRKLRDLRQQVKDMSEPDNGVQADRHDGEKETGSLVFAETGIPNHAPQGSEDKDEAMFREMHQKIVDGKLFLDPDFSRDKLVRLTLSNKNKVGQLLRVYAHNNFNGYVNELRVEYALKLLRRNPDITMKALCMDSGFNSQRTFYRFFQQKYGMTPLAYKDNYLAGLLRDRLPDGAAEESK